MEIQLRFQRVTESERPDLESTLQQYLLELSPFTGDQPDQQGNHSYPYLKFYWQDPERVPLFLVVAEKVAGFALIRRFIDPDNGNPIWELAEFFILPESRRRGLGRRSAELLWQTYPGTWQISVLHKNDPAQIFWKAILENKNNLTLRETVTTLVYQFDA